MHMGELQKICTTTCQKVLIFKTASEVFWLLIPLNAPLGQMNQILAPKISKIAKKFHVFSLRTGHLISGSCPVRNANIYYIECDIIAFASRSYDPQ